MAPKFIQINCNVSGTPTDIPVIRSDGGGSWRGSFDGPTRVIFMLPATAPPAGWGANVVWDNGKDQRFIVPPSGGSYEGDLIEPIPVHVLDYGPVVKPLPPIPSRQQVCGIQLTFQGLMMPLTTGAIPWFELGFQCQDEPNRRIVYSTKHSVYDTHLIVEFMKRQPVYNSIDEQPYKRMFSPDFEDRPQLFYELVREIIVNDFIPIVVFDGDNGDNPVDGYPNALRQLPILAAILGPGNPYGEDLTPYILFARFWDGVFYGSTPENVQNFGTEFRNYIPNGYLAIEHNPGHIPVGGGPGDYQPGGMMDGYDVVCSEYDYNVHQDSTWQIAGRTLGPAYIRPSDQPSWDDPNPPFYLVDSPRGPRYTCAFEWQGEYFWVRGRQTAEYQQNIRNYMKAMGYTYTG